MFAIYKRHNNQLYNKLVELSRNKFFYQDLKLPDTFETRVLLICFHLAIIFKVKKKDKVKDLLQKVFDNVFQNIEINIRELGYGDTKVNKTMKTLNKIFFDILVNIDKEDFFSFKNNNYLLNKYFYKNVKNNREKTHKLAKYLEEFENYSFDLDVDNVLNGSLDFKYR